MIATRSLIKNQYFLVLIANLEPSNQEINDSQLLIELDNDHHQLDQVLHDNDREQPLEGDQVQVGSRDNHQLDQVLYGNFFISFQPHRLNVLYYGISFRNVRLL